MNQLSWLLYAAETFNGLKGFLLIGLVPALVVSALVVALSVPLWSLDVYSWDSDDTKERKRGWPSKAWKIIRRVLTAIAIIIPIGLMIPSKDTLMLIAASEVGETVLASEKAQEIGGEAGALASDSLKLLRKFITDQLADAAAPDV